jgi:hypothetical protein
VVVYLPAGQARSIQPSLRAEAESLLESAGYAIEWRDSARERGDAANVVMVQFAGDCSAPATPTVTGSPVKSGSSLASAVVQDGAILPFARVDCSAVRSVLDPLAAREAPARRSYIYGRAIGRLIAHELYHILAQTREHTGSGIGKPCFTAADLVSERFEFEGVAVSRMRPTRSEPLQVDSPDVSLTQIR